MFYSHIIRARDIKSMNRAAKGWGIETTDKYGDLTVFVGNWRGNRLFVRKLLHDIDKYENQNLKAELVKIRKDAMEGHTMAVEGKKEFREKYGDNPQVRSSLGYHLQFHLKAFGATVGGYIFGAMPLLLVAPNPTSALIAWSYIAAGVAALPLIGEGIRGVHQAKIWRAFKKAGIEADSLLPTPEAYLRQAAGATEKPG